MKFAGHIRGQHGLSRLVIVVSGVIAAFFLLTAVLGIRYMLQSWSPTGKNVDKLLKQQKYKEAISPLEAAAGALPKHPLAHYVLGVCYDRTGKQRGAYDEYRNALAVGLGGEEQRQALRRVAVLEPLMNVAGAR